MGDEIAVQGAVTLQTKLPSRALIRLVKDGKVVKEVSGDTLTFSTDEPGAYRVEVYRRFLGKLRGWIFSNPIYLRQAV